MRPISMLVGFCMLLLLAGCEKRPAPLEASIAPAIVVTSAYPGASALEVANALAGPIEQQVNGVENLLHLVSRCTDDGDYVLVLTFKPRTDLAEATALVQQRVQLAIPTLPEEAKLPGISVRRASPGPVLFLSLASDKARPGQEQEAVRQVREALLREVGVGAVDSFGLTEPRYRVTLDPDRLAALGLTVTDVTVALREQNLGVAPGVPGLPPRLNIQPQGRLPDLKDLADIVVKTVAEMRTIRLKDVAQVTLQQAAGQGVRFNGKACVALGVHPVGGVDLGVLNRSVGEALTKLRPNLPEGFRLETALDFVANRETEYLLVELFLPDGATVERTRQTTLRFEEMLGAVDGVEQVLTLPVNPLRAFRQTSRAEDSPTFLLSLTGKTNREVVAGTIRKKLEAMPGVAGQLRYLTSRGGTLRSEAAVELAVTGPDLESLQELAAAFARRLRANPKLVDVGVDPDSRPRRQWVVGIDRDRCQQMGVSLSEVNSALQVALGMDEIGDFNRFGRNVQVVIQPSDPVREPAELIKQLKVRGSEGKMVPLGTLAAVRRLDAPRTLLRVDLQPAVMVSVNRLGNVAEDFYQTEFEAARRTLQLPVGYRLTILPER